MRLLQADDFCIELSGLRWLVEAVIQPYLNTRAAFVSKLETVLRNKLLDLSLSFSYCV